MSQTIEIFNNINEKDRKQEFVNISKIIEDSLQFVKGEFEASCIAFESNLKTFEDLRIITYSSELQQCIISVLNNSKDAIIYNKINNGKIKINLSKIKNFIEINIQDNGGGIKQEFIEQVFEAYFTTKHEFQGTGLGLFVVKKIVTESLNGEISLENFESGLLLTIKIPALQYLA